MATSVDTATGLRHYLEILSKHKRIVILAVLVVPIVAYVYSILQPPAFQSTAKVLLSRQNIAANLTGAAGSECVRVSTARDRRRPLSRASPRSLGELCVPASAPTSQCGTFSPPRPSFRLATSDLLEFNVTNVEPWVAEQLAGAYARQYTRYRRELDTGSGARARAQLQNADPELRRTGETSSRLYASLLDKEQQLATFEALQTSNAYVVQDSNGSIQVQPTTRRNLMLGLGFGVLLALGLTAVAHALDTRGKTVKTLEDQLGVPLLARIPPPPTGDGALVMRSAPSGVHAEAYRILRANLEFVNRGIDGRVIMATSAVEGEGKSTTIANLALAYAREGKRVIVVDLDLRRPTVARMFGVSASPGVVDAAYGRTRLERILEPVDGGAHAHSLMVLPSVSVTTDVGEFAASDQLRDLLRDLRDRADYVFVDAPPLLVSSDAITLGAIVDGIVLVTGPDSLRWEALDDVIRALSMCNAPTLGWVVTGTETMPGYAAYMQHQRSRLMHGASRSLPASPAPSE